MAAIPNIDLVLNVVTLISHFSEGIPSMSVKIQSESSKYFKDITQSALMHIESVEAKQKSDMGYFPFEELKWYCDVYKHIYKKKTLKRKQETRVALDKLYDVLTFDYVSFIEANMDKFSIADKCKILDALFEIDKEIGKFLSYTLFIPQTRPVQDFLSGQSLRIRRILSDYDCRKL